MTDMKLFVGNLPFSATDADLRAKFSEVGKVVSARVIVDRDTNRSRGFGFVEMATPEQAKNAIKRLHETTLMGRNMIVREAEMREARVGRRY